MTPYVWSHGMPQSASEATEAARKKAAHAAELRKQVEDNKRRKAEAEAKAKAEEDALEARIVKEREELARRHAAEEAEKKRKEEEQARVRPCTLWGLCVGAVSGSSHRGTVRCGGVAVAAVVPVPVCVSYRCKPNKPRL